MMREIKFRAWDVESNEMTLPNDILEVLVSMKNEVYAMVKGRNETLGGINRDNTILMQYTGLKDINGVEIYEGDIVKGWYMEKGIKHRFIGLIKFVTGCFLVDGVKQYRGQRQELNIIFQPIGNIYENAELLGDNQ